MRTCDMCKVATPKYEWERLPVTHYHSNHGSLAFEPDSEPPTPTQFFELCDPCEQRLLAFLNGGEK